MRDMVPMCFVRFDDSIPAYEDCYDVWSAELGRSWDDSGPITDEEYGAYLLMCAGPDAEALDDEPIREATRISDLGLYRKGHSRRHPKHLTLRDHRVVA